MTLPYGSTQQSCRAYIREYIASNSGKFGVVDDDRAQWKLAMYATPYMWTAIENVVVAAREGMDWLQECAGRVSKAGVYARWLSPVDFPVYQHYSNYEDVRVRTDLFGSVRLTVRGKEKGVQRRRARNGVAPNYVHSLDSSHMVLVINEAEARGINSLAMIHDDFGTHACDVPELFDLIRVTFVRMYGQKDWLLAWKREMERLDESIKLEDPPPAGDLDVMEVLDSKFFFG
jgi:DNA-directed RNA polymerase